MPLRWLPLSLALAFGALGCVGMNGAVDFQAGTNALAAGDAPAAVARLEAAAEALPDVSEVHNHLGLAYELAGREADALQAFERAVALDCDNQPAAHNLALAEWRDAQRRGEAVGAAPVAAPGAPDDVSDGAVDARKGIP